MDIEFTLGEPVSFRSHFLFLSPLIALGSNYKNESIDSREDLWVLLHEYLHFEDYTSWPCTSMNYLQNASNVLKLVEGYRKYGINELSENCKSLSCSPIIPHSSGIKVLDGNRCSITEGKIGGDILLESSAILNYLVKPDNSLTDYSSSLATWCRDNISEANKVHAVGVNITLNAVEKLKHITFGGEKPSSEDEFFTILPARLHQLIATYGFGYSLLLCGFNAKEYKWDLVYFFVLQNHQQIKDTYTSIVNKIFSDVLTKHEFSQFLDILNLGLRDLSIISYHCYFLISQNNIYKKSTEYFPNSTQIQQILCQPTLNILKLLEALNHTTLRKYNAQNLKPYWPSVPVIMQAGVSFTGVRLDFNRENKNDWTFRWSDTLTEKKDYYHLYSWVQMQFTNQLSESLMRRNNQCSCPIYDWAKRQHESDNELENFLHKFCNKSMAVDVNLSSRSKKTIYPSEEYCNYSLGKNNTSNNDCYFHQTLYAVLDSPI